MTLPIYCCVHIIYGALMGRLLFRHIQNDGEFVGIPLIVTLTPVALLTCPLGVILLRHAGGWFSHGLFAGDNSLFYEQFHFGLLMLCIATAVLATLGGLLAACAYISRNDQRKMRLLVVVPSVMIGLIMTIRFRDIFWVIGSQNTVFWHPAGLVSVSIVATLASTLWLTQKRVLDYLNR